MTGRIVKAFDHQQNVHYAAGAMLLDADDPSIVIARSAEPLLQAETEHERGGIVPNVVFPTAIEEIDGVHVRVLRHGGLEDRGRAAGPRLTASARSPLLARSPLRMRAAGDLANAR